MEQKVVRRGFRNAPQIECEIFGFKFMYIYLKRKRSKRCNNSFYL